MRILLSRTEIREALSNWYRSWNEHNLEGVMSLFHDDILFVNWAGNKIKSKKSLRKAWRSWFQNHGDFFFYEEETFIDETKQKALFRWILSWPSMEENYVGAPEKREGVDVIHFKDTKIIKKLTFSKTVVEIDGRSFSCMNHKQV